MNVPKLSKHLLIEILVTTSLFIAGTILLAYRIGYEAFWADEGFTAALSAHSFAKILHFSKIEVHSQLYYWSVKVFTSIFGTSELAFRSFSLIGALALAMLGPTAIRRLFGKASGLLFAVTVFVTPAIIAYSHEARMYTWAAFLTLAMSLYAFLAAKDGKIKDIVLFGLYLALSMYIHVVGLVGAFIFNVLFLVLLVLRRNFDFLKKYAIAVGVAVLLFIPRLIVLFEQAKAVSENFWIPPVSSERILATLFHPFSLRFYYTPSLTTLGTFFYIAVIIGIILVLVKRKKHFEIPLIQLAAFILTFLFVVIYSLHVKPILEPRYLLTVTPWIMFAFVIQISDFDFRAGIAVVVIYLFLAMPVNSESWKYKYNGPMHDVYNHLSPILQNETVFLHIDELTLGTFTYYFPDHKHYFLATDESIVYWHLPIFDRFGGHGETVEGLVGDYKSVILVDREYGFNSGRFAGEYSKLGKVVMSERYQTARAWFKPTIVQYEKD